MCSSDTAGDEPTEYLHFFDQSSFPVDASKQYNTDPFTTATYFAFAPNPIPGDELDPTRFNQ